MTRAAHRPTRAGWTECAPRDNRRAIAWLCARACALCAPGAGIGYAIALRDKGVAPMENMDTQWGDIGNNTGILNSWCLRAVVARRSTGSFAACSLLRLHARA